MAESKRTLPKGLRVLGYHYLLYFATLIAALAPLPLAINLIFSLANGIIIGLLFIIGHDAGHNSFVPSLKWNRWIGRITFIPSGHAASQWRVVHNENHHARTNLKGVDTVWAPMSLEEYRNASAPRRSLERIYRGPVGSVFYYYLAFWFPRMLFPLAPELRRDWRRHLPDCAFALAGFLFTAFAIAIAGRAFTPDRPLGLIITIGWAVPFAVWNLLMAFTIYVNHTHPAIPWFRDEADWSRGRTLAPDTASVIMPVNIATLWTNLMLHNSHHVQTRIPVYAIPEAEAELKKNYARMLEYRLTLRAYRSIYKSCKLFDFERMCWTDFNGVPTTKAAIPRPTSLPRSGSAPQDDSVTPAIH